MRRADRPDAGGSRRALALRHLGRAALVRVLLGALLLAAAVLPVRAQEAPRGDAAAAAPAAGVPEAVLRLGNRSIVTLRAVLFTYTPAQRVEAAARRIELVLARGGPGAVRTETMADGVALTLDGATVVLVTPGDTQALLGETPGEVAGHAAARLQLAVDEWREQHTARRLLLGVGMAAVATLAYLLLVGAIRRVASSATRRLARSLVPGTRHLRTVGLTSIDERRVLAWTRTLVSLAAWSAGLAATYVWLTVALRAIPYTRAWGEELQGFLIASLGSVTLAILAAVPGLLFVAIVVALARLAVRASGVFFARIEDGRLTSSWLAPQAAPVTRKLVVGALWLFALALAFPYIPGSHTEAFKGVSLLAGLMVSLGATGVVGQAASGLILVYSHALRRGEYVRIGDSEGTIVDIGIFTTQIRTGTGEEVTLPNSLVLSSTTRNYSRAFPGSSFVLDASVTIGYDAPWRQVHAMLLEAARRTEGVLRDPPPYVVQTALQDFYVAYRLVAHAAAEDPRRRVELLSALHASVQDVFNEYGVQIMSPHYRGDPATPKIVPKEHWHAPPAAGTPGEGETSA